MHFMAKHRQMLIERDSASKRARAGTFNNMKETSTNKNQSYKTPGINDSINKRLLNDSFCSFVDCLFRQREAFSPLM